MKTSEQIDQLATALVKAQATFDNAIHNKTNPHLKSKYANLASVREATINGLKDNGLAIIQGIDRVEDLYEIVTRMVHISGQWIESRYPLTLDAPQKMGSAITYGRRYCWAAMCGITSDDDDDGHAATTNYKPQPKQPPKPAPQNGSKPAPKTLDELKTRAEESKYAIELIKVFEEYCKAHELPRNPADGDDSWTPSHVGKCYQQMAAVAMKGGK